MFQRLARKANNLILSKERRERFLKNCEKVNLKKGKLVILSCYYYLY